MCGTSRAEVNGEYFVVCARNFEAVTRSVAGTPAAGRGHPSEHFRHGFRRTVFIPAFAPVTITTLAPAFALIGKVAASVFSAQTLAVPGFFLVRTLILG